MSDNERTHSRVCCKCGDWGSFGIEGQYYCTTHWRETSYYLELQMAAADRLMTEAMGDEADLDEDQ